MVKCNENKDKLKNGLDELVQVGEDDFGISEIANMTCQTQESFPANSVGETIEECR